jgi:hypothetical protein
MPVLGAFPTRNSGTRVHKARIGRRAASRLSRPCQRTFRLFRRISQPLPAPILGRNATGMARNTLTYTLGSAALALTLSGCGKMQGEFPSLAKRAYEMENPVAEPEIVAAPVTTALPADLQAKTDSLLARSRTAHAAYQSALPAAQAAVQSATNAATGSEAWVNAHMVLSRADSARTDGLAALGEIDTLISKQREAGADAGLLALLNAPQQQIADQVASENAEIDRLAKQIGL